MLTIIIKSILEILICGRFKNDTHYAQYANANW